MATRISWVLLRGALRGGGVGVLGEGRLDLGEPLLEVGFPQAGQGVVQLLLEPGILPPGREEQALKEPSSFLPLA